jgi:hypothetical protein
LYGEFENERKKDKKIDLPEPGFEPSSLKFEGDGIKSRQLS